MASDSGAPGGVRSAECVLNLRLSRLVCALCRTDPLPGAAKAAVASGSKTLGKPAIFVDARLRSESLQTARAREQKEQFAALARGQAQQLDASLQQETPSPRRALRQEDATARDAIEQSLQDAQARLVGQEPERNMGRHRETGRAGRLEGRLGAR